MEPQEIRSKAVQIARSLGGLGANTTDPAIRQRYMDVIAPGEEAAMQREMCAMSGCALVVAGVWRGIGIQGKEIDSPYKVGTAVSRLLSMARAAKAWVPFKKDVYPGPGDMVLVGDNGAGGVEHVYTVVDITAGDQVEIESVDGGQRDHERFQLVAIKRRIWKGQRDCVVNATDPGGNACQGRIIQGWVDITRLPTPG